MSKTFKVGERAIVVVGKKTKGWEVTIVEPLQLCVDPEGNTWFGYPTDRTLDGLQLCPRPHHMKRKSDDEGPRAEDKLDIGSWDKVGWTPHKSPAGAA